jgi:hypothetical protein
MGTISLGLKRQGFEVNRSPPSSAEIKMVAPIFRSFMRIHGWLVGLFIPVAPTWSIGHP